MTEAQQLADDGLRFQEDALGNPTIVYRSRVIPCLYSTASRGATPTNGGFDEEIQLTAIVRKSAHPTRTIDSGEGWTADADTPLADEDLIPPHPGKTVIAQGKLYRVLTVEEDTAAAAWKVQLGSAKR